MAKKRKTTVIAIGFQTESFARASARNRFGEDVNVDVIKARKRRRR